MQMINIFNTLRDSKMFKPTLLVDFDETITTCRGLGSPPNSDAIAALVELKEYYRIVIYSCRANSDIFTPTELYELKNYLEEHQIPYDHINTRKPTFFALVDDRSINPTTTPWAEIVEHLIKAVS